MGIVSATALLIAAAAAAAPVAEPADESRASQRPALEPEYDPCGEEDADCAAAARQARADLAVRLAVAPERIESAAVGTRSLGATAAWDARGRIGCIRRRWCRAC